jgi:hypothetical protein
MYRFFTVVMFLLLAAGGCSWQANSASQKVNIDPFAFGSGQQVVSPANGN